MVQEASAADFEHERLTSLINSMVDGVIAVNDKVVVDIYNGAALNILDLNSSMQGKRLSDVCTLQDSNNQPVDISDLVRAAKKAYISRDFSIRYADGSKTSLYISIAPVHMGYGKSSKHSYVIVLRDITNEKSLEEERDEFISVVSHELRTPITIAEGNLSNAKFIFDRDLSTKIAVQSRTQISKALNDAHKQTLFLADMINDLSTLSRAERGTLTLDIESINISDLLHDIAENYTAEAEAKGLTLTIEPHPELELAMSGKLYVREIMQNFVTNAIKYTDKGGVTIGARPADKGTLIWIEDSGIGISKADQEKIYDKFFRAENYQTRKTSGTGLGLYVTIKLAHLLHAEITTSSMLGKGSKFSIYFPNLQ